MKFRKIKLHVIPVDHSIDMLEPDVWKNRGRYCKSGREKGEKAYGARGLSDLPRPGADDPGAGEPATMGGSDVTEG